MSETNQNPVSAGTPPESTAQTTAHALGYPGNANQTPITTAQFSQLDSHANGLSALADALKIIMTLEQLKALPKVGPQNLEFGREVLEHLKAHPEMSAGLVDPAQLQADLAEVERLTPIYNKIQEAAQVLRDRIRIASGEFYQGSLAAYRGNHLRAEMGDPVAQTIDRELKPRFHQNHKPKPKAQDAGTQTEPEGF